MDVVVRYGDDLADVFCEFPDDVIRIAPYELWIGHQPGQIVSTRRIPSRSYAGC